MTRVDRQSWWPLQSFIASAATPPLPYVYFMPLLITDGTHLQYIHHSMRLRWNIAVRAFTTRYHQPVVLKTETGCHRIISRIYPLLSIALELSRRGGEVVQKRFGRAESFDRPELTEDPSQEGYEYCDTNETKPPAAKYSSLMHEFTGSAGPNLRILRLPGAWNATLGNPLLLTCRRFLRGRGI